MNLHDLGDQFNRLTTHDFMRLAGGLEDYYLTGTLWDLWQEDGVAYGRFVHDSSGNEFIIHCYEYDGPTDGYWHDDQRNLRSHGWGWSIDINHCTDRTVEQ